MAKTYENSGTLSRNKEKDDEHPNWPDYKGKANVDGVDYWLSAWLKESQDGGKFMSLSFQPKQERGGGGGRRGGSDNPREEKQDRRQQSDDIPF